MIADITKEYIALIPNLFSSFSELNKNTVKLSHLQHHVIEFIYMQQRPLNLKEICVGLDIAKQQLTPLIRDLEMEGYVTKLPDTRDRRAVLVSLTEEGKRILDKKWTTLYHNISEKVTKLSEEEQLDLKFALHKVNHLLKKLDESY
ncbi:hypothetical protein GCM10011391_12050 [Pullulanibacillus camelliae]|uniref:HTH marR-type domain-containing protein n=1 Tax=Pullulanibacillus camelliae TaxID=1707096 RepID=A0A8J2YGB9_9BACL|nr:winged helix DNA-binding protein [Pullulanibacillus camelliae]GGE34969.1 hypothetical protein GCM10011391_12050 [Pullulanibacillus camelliae]